MSRKLFKVYLTTTYKKEVENYDEHQRVNRQRPNSSEAEGTKSSDT
jgi:hypothetical protein